MGRCSPWRQQRVLEGPPVKLIHGLASTKEKANLAADRALGYNRFIDPGAQTRMATNSTEARAVFTCAVESLCLQGNFPLRSPDGTLIRVAEILSDPDAWHGARFADPLEPSYRGDKRIAYACMRPDFGAPYIFTHAHGGLRFALAMDDADSQDNLEVGDYRETPDGIEWLRRTKDGDVWVPLTNFRARIVSDITRDDGIETTRAVEIEGKINGRSHKFAVSGTEFGQMGWPLEHLGAEAIVQPGHGLRDRARTAIQIVSGRIPHRRVYSHTGWRQIGGSWAYMHGGGTLGAEGPVCGLEVELPEQLEGYVLPIAAENLVDAVATSLAMRKVAPDRVTIPLLGAVHRAVLGGADFSVHLSGLTGAQKSEIAALSQQHYGAAMDARALPGSWTSTGNALEAIASAAKDAVIVIDDYVPQGTTADRQRLNAVADRVLRAQGNRSGRARLRSDTSLRRTRPPRGLIISTGEEVPGGQSLRARMVVIEMHRGDVDLEQLTLAQRAAADGFYVMAMAGFIRWLAPRLDEVRADFLTITRERRTNVQVAHARTADILAQLFAAWSIWLKFIVATGAINSNAASAIEDEVWSTLAGLAPEQHDLQRANDPVDRFYSLVDAVLASGKAHISSAACPDQRPADVDDANALGWRRDNSGAWHPQGPCIGWLAADGIYLEPDASYAAAQQLGSSSGEGVGVTALTLHRRMFARGSLLSTEIRGGETRLKVRKFIGGKRRSIFHIARDLSA
jgi:Domain of unknown function (DUF927)